MRVPATGSVKSWLLKLHVRSDLWGQRHPRIRNHSRTVRMRGSAPERILVWHPTFMLELLIVSAASTAFGCASGPFLFCKSCLPERSGTLSPCLCCACASVRHDMKGSPESQALSSPYKPHTPQKKATTWRAYFLPPYTLTRYTLCTLSIYTLSIMKTVCPH